MKHLDTIKHIKIGHIGRRKLSILLTSVVVGFLVVMQARSFTDATVLIGRDDRADVFREIKVLKTTNEKLADEIKDLENQLSKTSDNEKAIESVRQEIDKYRILTGRVDIEGPGITMTINGDIKAIWLTDTVNELFNSGAEAISINGIRLTGTTNGFDTIPNGQIVLNGSILKAPFEINAIGERTVLTEAMEQPYGIIQRMQQSIRDVEIKITPKDIITMEKVL
jgi:uncharacterized protein YlxW (UPF0749 family)